MWIVHGLRTAPKALAYIEGKQAGACCASQSALSNPSPLIRNTGGRSFAKTGWNRPGKGVYIDEAQNVVFPLNCEQSNQITLFTAHMDTVFPDLEPLPMEEETASFTAPVQEMILATWRFC